jgi:hypothetical protein
MDGRDRPPETGADLRSRLCDMRAALVERLERRIEGGDLALLGSVNAGIDAVDATSDDDAAPEDVAPAARAVVSDDGEKIALTFYAADGAACGLELDPVHAVALAGRLIEAASVRLCIEGNLCAWTSTRPGVTVPTDRPARS